MKTVNFAAIKDFRKKHGLNQEEFWSQVCVTQSGGSRYESGRKIPDLVKILLHKVYIEKDDLTNIRKKILKQR